MPTAKQKKAALLGAIEKWKWIAAGKGVDLGTDNCPLCHLYYRFGCRGCPVYQKTGKSDCWGTPYDEYRTANRAAQKQAVAMLNFLQDLLPRRRAARRKPR